MEKSPPFAKGVVVVFSDDASFSTMKLFMESKAKEWMNPMLKDIIMDWNLTNEKGEKFPINLKGLDMIKSLKLRNWILQTLQEVVIETLSIVKKKSSKD